MNTKNKKGKFNQGATIFSNDPQNPQTKISLSGIIKRFISIEPGAQLRLRGFYGNKIKKKVTITSLEEQPFKITGITSNIEALIEYELKTIEENKSYSLEIKTRSGIKAPFQGKVVLKTNSQKKPELVISLMGELKKEVKVAPAYLYYGIIDTSKKIIDPKSLKRTVMVNTLVEGNLTIDKIEPGSDWITTETETNEKGKKYTIVIKLDKDKLPKGTLRERVNIHTKYNERIEVTPVIIEAKVI